MPAAWVIRALTLGLLACTLPIAARGLYGPPGAWVHIRWQPSVDAAERQRLETAWQLVDGQEASTATWRYDLTAPSVGRLRAIVEHAAVEDTHFIDRQRYTIEPEALRTTRRHGLIAVGGAVAVGLVDRLATLLAVLAGLCVAVRHPMRVVRRLQPYLEIARGVAVDAWPFRSNTIWLPRWPEATRRAWSAEVTASAEASIAGWPLTAILLVSMGLRVAIVLSGGQFYWPDEARYETSREMTQLIVGGGARDAFAMLDTADHLLFKVVGIVPALVELTVGDDSRIPALLFALFSIVNIWLIGRIAQRMGADRTEAIFASALVALSASFFYYARHLVPYDAAMTFGLLALYVGARTHPRPWSSMLCGFLAACAFLTYAGYWTLGGAALLIHVAEAEDRYDLSRRVLLGGLGLAATIGALVGVNAALGGGLLSSFISFSRTVDQGSYAEGWRLPFEYLWHAEHLLLGTWIAGMVWWAAHLRVALVSRRVRAGLAGVLFIYGSLVICSVFLETFVVYGRLARQLVPFFCLLTAAALAHIGASMPERGRRLMPAIALVLLGKAVSNFREPLRQSFPDEFVRERPGVSEDLTQRMAVYTHHIYPVPEPVSLPAHYTVLKEARHPLQFLPYQYEGYTPAERRILRSTDIRMRLLAVGN